MTKKTQQERLVATLVSHMKATVIPSKSKKYVTLKVGPVAGIDTKYFVGKAGSLRFGRVFTESYPVLPSLKAKLLRIADLKDFASE